MTRVTLNTTPVTVRVTGGRATTVPLDKRTVQRVATMQNVVVAPRAMHATATQTQTRTINVGQRGLQGPPGGGGDKYFQFKQLTASAAWHVAHGLNKRPSVRVFDSAGTEVIGDVLHVDDNTLDIAFSAALAGVAYLN